ncbi:MAG: hypothetical protein IPG81_15130 [Sandaracinaceae bacterium]|nr:hypothetical protein [Sandaracinaceae bacterium]
MPEGRGEAQHGQGPRGRFGVPVRVGLVLASVIVSALLGPGAPVRAAAQWRDTETPPGQATRSAYSLTRDAEAGHDEPLWMRRVRTFRRFGGVLLGVGGLLIIAGELAFARGGSVDAVFATDVGGSVIGAVDLFTLVGAQVRRRRVQVHLGLREPMPERRRRGRFIGGGVLLGLAGVVAGATVLAVTNDSGCGDGSECEGSVAVVIIPSVLGSVFTVAGGALFVAGGAARLGARRRVRISVGANRGVPTLMAQF